MRSRPRGLVFGHRAVYLSFAPTVAMPDGTRNLQGAQPKDCNQFDSYHYSLMNGYSCLGFPWSLFHGQAAPAYSWSVTIEL
ncbi:hypothetical protein GXP69_11155 [Pontibacter sp. BT327]|uniref:Uncharacterized protein n=1 Tax=Pontibacter burrus TaxID=2704466 RepID=A0A6B3LXU5_9BACT|nr:hypothetical protein [Pontibacter burrus]